MKKYKTINVEVSYKCDVRKLISVTVYTCKRVIHTSERKEKGGGWEKKRYIIIITSSWFFDKDMKKYECFNTYSGSHMPVTVVMIRMYLSSEWAH